MTPINEQVRGLAPKPGRKLVLRKETIKNLSANEFSKNMAALYPSNETDPDPNPSELCETLQGIDPR